MARQKMKKSLKTLISGLPLLFISSKVLKIQDQDWSYFKGIENSFKIAFS